MEQARSSCGALTMLLPVVLSGGSGTRLWPLSRTQQPKQFLSLIGDRTLLQSTLLRLSGMGTDSVAAPIVVCNEEHRFLVAEQFEELGLTAGGILLEPFGRNTAPALTLAALVGRTPKDDDPVLLVMPADHVITDLTAFQNAVAEGCRLAADGWLVTFGIVPTRPETGFGYVQRGDIILNAACRVVRFAEKPTRPIAELFISSGEYLWNSGIFMMRRSVWLDKIGEFRPDILAACRKSFDTVVQDASFIRINEPAFRNCPSDSIDYVVMEGAAADHAHHRVAVVPLDAGWSDVGAWPALMDLLEKDADGNAVSGDVLIHDTRNSLIQAHSRLVAAIGVQNLLIVETPDAVLVADKAAAQDVKVIADALKRMDRPEHVAHRRVHRPWGSFEGIDSGTGYQVKRLTLKPGASISLQLHQHRAEHWVVVQGRAQVTRGDEIFELTENQSTYIPPQTRHRLENSGRTALEIIEVQSGNYLGEDDIVRFEDNYGRHT